MSLVCQGRGFSSPASRVTDFRHSAGRSRTIRRGSPARAYSPARPAHRPTASSARTSASRHPAAAAAVITAIRASERPAYRPRGQVPVQAIAASSAASGTRPPRRGSHGAPSSSTTAPGGASPGSVTGSAAASSAASSASSPAHTCGPHGRRTAVTASSRPIVSICQPPVRCRDPGGRICPPGPAIGAGSKLTYRSARARATSRSSATAANRRTAPAHACRPRETRP